MDLLSLFTGILGGACAGVLTAWLTGHYQSKIRKDERRFNTKKEAYAKFLAAVARVKFEGRSQSALQDAASHIEFIYLVGSKVVVELLEQCVELASDSPEHQERFIELKQAMRNDLEIQ